MCDHCLAVENASISQGKQERSHLKEDYGWWDVIIIVWNTNTNGFVTQLCRHISSAIHYPNAIRYWHCKSRVTPTFSPKSPPLPEAISWYDNGIHEFYIRHWWSGLRMEEPCQDRMWLFICQCTLSLFHNMAYRPHFMASNGAIALEIKDIINCIYCTSRVI